MIFLPSPRVDSVISLESLRPGTCARIERLTGEADDVHRLREFGFYDGAVVEMVRAGDPCIVKLEGNMVCLRGGQRVHVFVKPVAAPCV